VGYGVAAIALLNRVSRTSAAGSRLTASRDAPRRADDLGGPYAQTRPVPVVGDSGSGQRPLRRRARFRAGWQGPGAQSAAISRSTSVKQQRQGFCYRTPRRRRLAPGIEGAAGANPDGHRNRAGPTSSPYIAARPSATADSSAADRPNQRGAGEARRDRPDVHALIGQGPSAMSSTSAFTSPARRPRASGWWAATLKGGG